MSGSNVTNILVLGTKGVDTLKFTNLFGTYLKYDTYEDSTGWMSTLSQNKVINDIKTSMLIIGNKKLNFIHAPKYEHAPQQISSILLHFINKQKITAIIFLIKGSEMDNECIWEYKNSLLPNLKQIADGNILYLIVANNSSYKREQFILDSFCDDRRKYYFQEQTFRKVSKDNWQENVEFSKSIYNYIVGDEKNDGLQDYYIQSVIPPTSMLKLVDDLLIFLIQIYICAEYCKLSYKYKKYDYFYLDGYKKNVTTCYGNCNKWEQHWSNEELKLKNPKICHAPCKCTEFDADVSKCTIFDTPDQTCLQCDCKSDTHTKSYFTYGSNYTSSNFDNEKYIAIKILTTFYIYKKQNQEVYNFENVFLRLLDMQDANHRAIFDNFKKEFEKIIQKLDQKSNPITSENILTSLKKLYKITETSVITPEFIGGIFPKDFHLEIITNEQNDPNKQTEINVKFDLPKIKNKQTEMQALKNEIAELKQMVKELLNRNNSSNVNDLNSKLNPEVQASTSNNLNQNDEKEVNWNIETK